MKKNIVVNIEEVVKNELQAASNKSEHQMVQGSNGQMVDAHINMNEPQSTIAETRRGQVESILVLQTDSDVLREIENVETENEVLERIPSARIPWSRKKV
jgi:hypothetical protein